MKKVLIVMLVLALVMTSVSAASDVLEEISVYRNLMTVEINGEVKDVDNFVHEGTTYIALRQVSELLGAEVTYIHETKTASIVLNAAPKEMSELIGGTYYKFDADPQAGFNYPYYVYLPLNYQANEQSFLVVECNNTGVSDQLGHHEVGVISSVSNWSYGKEMADRLNMPFLMPVFIRPETNWDDYTHDLDRSSLLVNLTEAEKAIMGDYERIDLQLVAMIEDAQARLSDVVSLDEQILMTGYSASAKFANKFSMLHPERIKAMVIGGINAATMIPKESYNGITLNYPNGIADYEIITGHAFDAEAYGQIHQLLIMGAEDDNDVTMFRDGWDQNEAEDWWMAMGEDMMGVRWPNLQQAYNDMDVSIQCHTYEGIGHSITNNLLEDSYEFLRQNLGENFVEINLHTYGN